MRKTKIGLWGISLLAIGLFSIGVSFSYNPTSEDTQNLNSLKSQLDLLIVEDRVNLWDFYDQLKTLEVEYDEDSRLEYMLGNLKDYIYGRLFTFKTADKVSSESFKQEFLSGYNTGFSLELDDSLQNCTGWYNTLDDISFAYNFPTALTIATWYRESTCAYYLPNNGDGPFQIVNEDYGTGEITQAQFVDTVEDFMEFTKSKFDRYDGQLTGHLSYTGFDLTGISNFAALYNGGIKSGDVILPNNENYLFDGYGVDFSGATRYGIFPQFIKALERELDNEY